MTTHEPPSRVMEIVLSLELLTRKLKTAYQGSRAKGSIGSSELFIETFKVSIDLNPKPQATGMSGDS